MLLDNLFLDFCVEIEQMFKKKKKIVYLIIYLTKKNYGLNIILMKIHMKKLLMKLKK